MSGWKSKCVIAAGAMAVGAAVLAAVYWPRRTSDPPRDSFPLPAVSTSPFLNTQPGVRYIGSQACQSCHPDYAASYRRTGMGRSMAALDIDQEPPDGVFDHAASKRRYEIYRKDGQLWHREFLLAGGADPPVLNEHPMKYVIGSGRHSRTYAVEIDGFLVESPVTWYASKKAWGMSPGYDRPNHQSFERAVGESCLTCHAGQAPAVDGSLHKMRVLEAAIGCERCHGPGALHAERHAGRELFPDRVPGAIDHTIVNPLHLSRELADAICQQCHLRSNAMVLVRGKKLDDFRPGLPRQDFHLDYRLEAPNAPMTVVGHVEQMHLSRCFQASKSMSCLTCHNPHDEPRPKNRDQHYQAICLSCHQPQACTVDSAVRQRDNPANNCVKCHMPRSPTEIPHLAFTHHRIGLHKKEEAGSSPRHKTVQGQLKPLFDLSRFSDADQKRGLGLGYLEAANMADDPDAADAYRRHALDLLTRVRERGLRDPVLEASYARLRFDLELDGVLEAAESALALPLLESTERCTALFFRADALAENRRYAEALGSLRQLVGLRRHSVDWLLLAKCAESADRPAAIEALENAVRINPRLWQVQRHLAEHHQKQGNPQKAAYHRARAAP